MANGTPLRPGTRLRSHLREYTVLSTLGSGGFGITYLVEATVKIGNVTGRMKFAIKEHYVSLLCERDDNSQSISYSDSASATVEKSRRAFIKEAQRVKNLGIDHPNIVPINEVFEANNTAYYVMEYLEGETLSAYVSSRGTMTFNDTITLFRPIIDAVAVLHTNKLTHYDIKPANIILTHAEDGALRPVLIDFGLAKHYDEEGMDTSTLGTGGYSAGYSPVEQYPGLREFTPQADVYALAASMYYCLTGEKPYPAEKFSIDDMASRLNGIAPAPFIDIMKQALAFRQADRIPDANTLYTAIYDSEATRIDSRDARPVRPPKINNGQTTLMRPPKTDGNFLPPKRINDSSTFGRLQSKTLPRNSNRRWVWICLVSLILIGGTAAFFLLKDKSTTETSETYPPEEEVIAAARKYYDVVGTFKEDMAIVGKDGKFGFIDRNGNEIVAPKYDFAAHFSEGLAAVEIKDNKSNHKCGFINKTGKLVIPFDYDRADSFSEGLARVEKDGKWGFTDKTGKVVIPLEYDEAISFSEGLALVRKGDWEKLKMDENYYPPKWGFIDKTGKEVIPLEYDEAISFSEGLATVEKDGKYGFINKSGEEEIPFEYDRASEFSEGLAAVKKDGNWGFIDHNGEVIIPLLCYALSFSEGLAAVNVDFRYSDSGCWGFINRNGDLVIPFLYEGHPDEYPTFREGLAAVGKDNKHGFIDKTGKMVIPFEYTKTWSFSDGLALVDKDGKFGYIDMAGNVMWLPQQ